MRKQGRFALAAALLLVVTPLTHAQHAPAVSVSPSRAVQVAPMRAPTTSAAFRSSSASPAMHTTNRVAGMHLTRTANLGAAGLNGAGVGAKAEAKAGSNSNSNGPDAGGGVGVAGSSGDPISLQQLLEPYPPYGFDFEHLNSINRDLELKAFIDPATQVRIATAERRLRHSPRVGNGGGFYVLDGDGAYAIPDESLGELNADEGETAGQTQQDEDPPAVGQQPQKSQREQRPIIIVQQAAQPTAEPSDAAAVTQEDAAPLRDVGEFTLVTRDGMEIEAVAFTRVKDKIVYITSEGARYTIALRDLDSDETIRVNQERGTPLQLPL